MRKIKRDYLSKSIYLVSIFLWVILWVSPFQLNSVQAGSGITVDIPASNLIPVMDGVCNPVEYGDATQVSITVGTSNTFPVYLKHTSTNAYFCFGDASGLPLPNGAASSVTVYIDRNDDGITNSNNADDFGVWMPYASADPPFAASWGTGAYNGADPGGWQAVKHQVLGGTPLWQVEFRISSQTLGGWNRQVGFALFYHWWQTTSDDYSWPANGIWAAPQLWGNGRFTTGSVIIGTGAVVPTLDGLCSAPEYADASIVSFDTLSGTVTAYLTHSLTDLYVCLTDLAVPVAGLQNEPNAALYLARAGTGGSTPSASDISLTISYSGTVHGGTGDGVGFSGPDPGGYAAAAFHTMSGWDAEFQISSGTIGNWFPRRIGLSVAEQSINVLGDGFGWPIGYSNIVPNTWGTAQLVGIGNSVYLPLVTR